MMLTVISQIKNWFKCYPPISIIFQLIIINRQFSWIFVLLQTEMFTGCLYHMTTITDDFHSVIFNKCDLWYNVFDHIKQLIKLTLITFRGFHWIIITMAPLSNYNFGNNWQFKVNGVLDAKMSCIFQRNVIYEIFHAD